MMTVYGFDDCFHFDSRFGIMMSHAADVALILKYRSRMCSLWVVNMLVWTQSKLKFSLLNSDKSLRVFYIDKLN